MYFKGSQIEVKGICDELHSGFNADFEFELRFSCDLVFGFDKKIKFLSIGPSKIVLRNHWGL
jgi:hypothetical protein